MTGIASGINAISSLPRSWSPARLDPAVFLEADFVTQSSGVASAVINKGSLAINALQATGPNQPSWNATGGPNSNPALIHTAPRFFTFASSAGWKTTQVTWVQLIKFDVDTGQWQTGLNSADDLSWNTGLFLGKNNPSSGNTNSSVATTGYATNAVPFSALGTSQWHLLVGRWNGSQVTGRRNGVSGTPDAFTGPIVHGAGPLVIGASIQALTPTYAFNLEGRWSSLLVIPRSISDTECARLEKWLSDKWGFSLT